MRNALEKLYTYRAACDGLNQFGIGMRRPEPAPVVLGTEILKRWLRDVENNDDFEEPPGAVRRAKVKVWPRVSSTRLKPAARFRSDAFAAPPMISKGMLKCS
jgi:hypothetical protein